MSGSVADLLERVAHALARPLAEPLRLTGLRGSASALALARLHVRTPRPIVVLTADTAAAETFAADLRFYAGAAEGRTPLERRIHVLPSWDIPPFEPLSPTRETIAARVEGLHHLRETVDPIVITTVDAWAQRGIPRDAFAAASTYVVVGETIAPGTLAARLVGWGYHRVPLVQDPGDLAVRGGLLDVHPPGYAQPVRLEFLGEEVERIRLFDAGSQRSGDPLEDVLLLPLREFGSDRLGAAAARAIDVRAADVALARAERRDLVEAVRTGLVLPGMEFLLPYLYPALGTLADFLPPNTLVWAEQAGGLEAAVETAWANVESHAARAEAEGFFHPAPEALYLRPAEWRERLAAWPRIEIEALEDLAGDAVRATTYATDTVALRAAPGAEGALAATVARLREWECDGTRLVLVAGSPRHRERLCALLAPHGLDAAAVDAPFEPALAAAGRAPLALVGTLSRGVRLPGDGLALVTETELFGERRQVRSTRRERPGDVFTNLAALAPDDYVVHVDHGVASYRGLKHMAVADTEGDYLHLEYAGGDRLYVPVDRINVVQRYVSADGAAPALDKLGGTSWERVKAKTKESLLAMAHDLLAIYAQREAHARPATTAPDPLYEEFVARFPFEETPGQQRAIDEVLTDLSGARAMDRLVCGDVGFGKTEVAMRAAFLSVLGGKQVAVLVPTTILAQQHLETFRGRFAGYPVTIEMLSRFRTAVENKATVAGLESGRVDLVIGTHRLLQKDIRFRALGLLVVDEEHRFGVKDKERIRALRATVDVLTLTATPIPRTLNMSLSGIRDLSVIETPPVDRLAIRTYVTRYDEGVIRDAVIRELGRGGQVFFVHNRVETIEQAARRLGELVPEAKIAVAHGQMPDAALERVMLGFLRGETNLLVTSAIIESGLDIPNANTLIVNRADTFGLAQLYQIRGRVGRSHHRAYAYLLIPGEHLITTDAQKRLRVLQELDDLGGGFRLAAHDLEIRGAGNLLGKQQSGHIAAVGLELYTHLLEQAVREVRGQEAEPEVEPEIQLGIPAYVPESYVEDVQQRLLLYKRLAGIRGEPDLAQIRAELEDRYGPVPSLVDTLLRLMALRRRLKDLHVTQARRRGDDIAIDFAPTTPLSVPRLLERVRGSRGRLKLVAESTVLVQIDARDHDGVIADLSAVLQKLASA